MFIVNGKSHCCNDTFTDVLYIAASKEYFFKYIKYFYAVRISISLGILFKIFIQIGFLRVMQENKSGCFFSEHSVPVTCFVVCPIIVYTLYNVCCCMYDISSPALTNYAT